MAGGPLESLLLFIFYTNLVRSPYNCCGWARAFMDFWYCIHTFIFIQLALHAYFNFHGVSLFVVRNAWLYSCTLLYQLERFTVLKMQVFVVSSKF